MATTPPSPLLEVALAAHRAGLTVVPPKENGTKAPDGPWKRYQSAPPDEAQIRTWYANGRLGLGVLCGAASGHLEMLELDHGGPELWKAFLARAEDQGLAELVDRVVAGYAERTPGGGVHLLYRCSTPVDGNLKLARSIDPDTGEVLVLFETRGEGGYVILAPSSGPVHPSGRAWELARGGFDTIATLDPDERAALLDLARSFDQMPAGSPEPQVTANPHPQVKVEGSWMDATVADFNARTTWAEILMPHGWAEMPPSRGVGYWCRPGKDPRDGHSATVNANGTDRFILWSTSVSIAGIEHASGPHSPSYDRFSVWAGYHHAGDRLEAAGAARRAGYGPAWEEAGEHPDPWAMIGEEAPAAPGTDPAPALDEPAPPPLDIRWTDTLGEHPEPEPPELVEGLLRRGELVALAAPRAIGKTFIGFNLASLLAQGAGRLFGRLEVRRAARVLYLQGELDRWGSQERWFRLHGAGELQRIASGAPAVPRVGESFDTIRIRTITRRTTTKVDGVVMSDEHVDAVIDPRLEAAIRNEGIDVVIIDPWAVYFSGKENSNDEVEAALAQLRAITLRTGVAWVVIHHISAKIEHNRLTEPEDLWRGATRLADWASTRITVLPHYSEGRRKELGLSRTDARRHVDVHFLRRSAPTDDFTARRRDDGWWEAWDDPEAGDVQADAKPSGRPPKIDNEQLVETLRAAGGTWRSMRDATAWLGEGAAAVASALRRAEEAGLVELVEGFRGAVSVHLIDDMECTEGPRGNPLRAETSDTSFRAVEMPSDLREQP